MGVVGSRLAPGWAKLAHSVLVEAREAVTPSVGTLTGPRLLKLEVRRGGGQLHLLWLLQPEDGEDVARLQLLRRRLACSSVRTCEVCGARLPWRQTRGAEVLCAAHDAPF